MNPADTQTSQWLQLIIGQFGVGGGIAIFMFMLWRRDSQKWSDSLMQQAADWRKQYELTLQVVKENTASNAVLSSAVDALHRRLDENGVGHRR